MHFSPRRSSTVDPSKLCYIHAYHHRFGVEPICAVLSEHGMKIAPQAYYRWLARPVRPAELEETYLVNAIVNIYRNNKCVYGVRKMWHAARRVGLALGRDQVGRLMRIAGIQGVRRGAHHTVTTVRDERAPRHPDLVKRGWKTPNRPDAVWVADFTYVWTACGFCYVCPGRFTAAQQVVAHDVVRGRAVRGAQRRRSKFVGHADLGRRSKSGANHRAAAVTCRYVPTQTCTSDGMGRYLEAAPAIVHRP